MRTFTKQIHHPETNCLSAWGRLPQCSDNIWVTIYFKYRCTHYIHIYVYAAVLSSRTCSFLFCSTMDRQYVDADGVGLQWFTRNGCCRWCCWMINEVEVEGRYCDACYVCSIPRDRYVDWHEAVAWRETAWADTVLCMVMLATKSVQDNPHAVP